MRYDDPLLVDMLCADYMFGTLKGSARSRFEQLLKQRAGLAQAFSWWESHMHLLADTVPAVKPPDKVWQRIETKLFNKVAQRNPPTNAWWRNFAFLSTALAASFATFLIMQSPKGVVELQPTTVALLTNDKTQAGWLLSLAKNKQDIAEIRAKSMASLEAKPNNSFELWLLPADKSNPVSLGLLPQQGDAVIKVPNVVLTQLVAGGLAVSVEPIGGSLTGQPTGAVLYQGKLTQI